jgi:antitoxin (DNA-binding transcriptional repressor) of toxin-antitoxin stability system
MRLTASRLRQDIYRVLDEVLETGVPVEIERRGRLLRIVPAEPSKGSSTIHELPERPYLRADPEEIVHVDWSGEWRP